MIFPFFILITYLDKYFKHRPHTPLIRCNKKFLIRTTATELIYTVNVPIKELSCFTYLALEVGMVVLFE